jgi:hypothetical protein
MTARLTSRGQRFRHHHAAAHADRGENHDPTGAPFAARQSKKDLISRPAIREQNPLEQAARVWRFAALQGAGAEDLSAVARFVEAWAGTAIRRSEGG